MSNKETLQSYNNRLDANNTSLNGILDIINELPEAGGEVNLQDKTVEITENGTQTISADSGYDGLNEVEVITNVASSGGGTPEVGFVINEFDSEGYAKTVTTYGLTTIPKYYFGAYSSSYTNGLIKNLKTIYLNNGITTVGSNGFKGSKTLEEITLPDTIETLETNSFDECSNLATIKLSNNLKTIGAYAFQNCTKLVLNTLPDSVTSLGSSLTFNKCTSLKQISFNNVARLNGSRRMDIFYDCTGLKAIWIGSAITEMSSCVFEGCTSLSKIFINRPRATVEAFSGYSYKFMYNANSTVEIICNDDEGFMTKEQFDAIDWATYIG